ncbi:hypothetical protein DUNSADRAFT_16176 [Dunaliella salina]|uniref:Uncharacterized protein n=1 Tax=Dunaliella salina TaxID=3046 RepID=A0ABQ7G439_DUNSA|nr:hypothetical protein DUNSADRAFT_16176 [Dunaliella salina]|eukprot:KAF5829373.1 hypothetical protein DUNSADRAFT_16176 [Dunaliella salina]
MSVVAGLLFRPLPQLRLLCCLHRKTAAAALPSLLERDLAVACLSGNTFPELPIQLALARVQACLSGNTHSCGCCAACAARGGGPCGGGCGAGGGGKPRAASPARPERGTGPAPACNPADVEDALEDYRREALHLIKGVRRSVVTPLMRRYKAAAGAAEAEAQAICLNEAGPPSTVGAGGTGDVERGPAHYEAAIVKEVAEAALAALDALARHCLDLYEALLGRVPHLADALEAMEVLGRGPPCCNIPKHGLNPGPITATRARARSTGRVRSSQAPRAISTGRAKGRARHQRAVSAGRGMDHRLGSSLLIGPDDGDGYRNGWRGGKGGGGGSSGFDGDGSGSGNGRGPSGGGRRSLVGDGSGGDGESSHRRGVGGSGCDGKSSHWRAHLLPASDRLPSSALGGASSAAHTNITAAPSSHPPSSSANLRPTSPHLPPSTQDTHPSAANINIAAAPISHLPSSSNNLRPTSPRLPSSTRHSSLSNAHYNIAAAPASHPLSSLANLRPTSPCLPSSTQDTQPSAASSNIAAAPSSHLPSSSANPQPASLCPPSSTRDNSTSGVHNNIATAPSMHPPSSSANLRSTSPLPPPSMRDPTPSTAHTNIATAPSLCPPSSANFRSTSPLPQSSMRYPTPPVAQTNIAAATPQQPPSSTWAPSTAAAPHSYPQALTTSDCSQHHTHSASAAFMAGPSDGSTLGAAGASFGHWAAEGVRMLQHNYGVSPSGWMDGIMDGWMDRSAAGFGQWAAREPETEVVQGLALDLWRKPEQTLLHSSNLRHIQTLLRSSNLRHIQTLLHSSSLRHSSLPHNRQTCIQTLLLSILMPEHL